MSEPRECRGVLWELARAWQPCSMLLLTAICVSGCLSVDERQIRPGVYAIATPASEFVNSEGRARVILNLRAQELCPHGFMRFREDRIIDTKGIEIMAWQVACTM